MVETPYLNMSDTRHRDVMCLDIFGYRGSMGVTEPGNGGYRLYSQAVAKPSKPAPAACCTFAEKFPSALSSTTNTPPLYSESKEETKGTLRHSPCHHKKK